MKTDHKSKGYQAEENLRFYFMKSGYYVVRGVPYQYENFDITDVDLFLYSKVSALSRERIIVDIKKKKTPQALERIFWVKGLQSALNVERSIVATTDNRQTIVKYGKEHDVIVLNGHTQAKIEKLAQEYEYRLTNDEFDNLIAQYPFQKLDGDWKNKIKYSKSLLLLGMEFDHINYWLDIGKFFANQVITNSDYKQYALRCLYLIVSFILIGIDFQTREVLFLDRNARLAFLSEGFTYGTKGELGINKTIRTALTLVSQTPHGSTLANQIQTSIMNGFNQLNSNILSEYFSRSDILQSLFELAKEFENLAMNRKFQHHSELSNTIVKSILFCLLDYWGISRPQFETLSI